MAKVKAAKNRVPVPDLDLFMKSFELEIACLILAKIVNLETDSSESRPDFEYLLEAYDDDSSVG